MSAPCLEWISNYAFPFAVDANITNMHCFATAPNKRTVAGAKGRFLQFFDASTAQRVSGPFYIGNDAIDYSTRLKFTPDITNLEFTPDGKFLFFGRLDKWFSVERGCVVDFPQFSGNSHIYKWGVFTRDGQCIVVKRGLMSNPISCQNKFCLPNLLALWALKEIEQSGDDEVTVSFCPDVSNQEEPYSRAGLQIERLFERLGIRQILGEGLGGVLRRHNDASESQGLWDFLYPCRFCRTPQELIRSEQDPSLKTVQERVIELYPNIFNYQVWDLRSGKPVLQQVFLQDIQLDPFTYLCHVSCVYSEAGLKMKCSGIEKAMSLCNIAIVTAVCHFSLELKMERAIQQVWPRHRHTGQRTKLQGFVSPELFREVHDDAFKIGLWRNIPRGFLNLFNCFAYGEILTCVSPEMKWVIHADDSLKVSLLQTGNQEQHHIHQEEPEYTFSKFTRFTFSNEDLYVVYSCEGSLQALSLTTGKIFSNVSGCDLLYLTRERQVGYLFRCGTEETAIFLTSLFSPFKCLPASRVQPSVVGKSVAAMFFSSNAVISVSSDSMVTLWQTTTFAGKDVITFSSKSSLTASSPQSLPVKNCALSSDGRLIAIHQEAKLELYSFDESELKFLHSVFPSKCAFTVPYCAFSADGSTLLFCIQDSRNASRFYAWDIKEEVFSASFKSPWLLTAECCYLSWNKQELVLCGDEIEIWEYAEHTCRLLTRLTIKKPYNSVKFSQCTVSVDNQFLVCCIADVILAYNLHAYDIDSSKQVLRGHLGRIEFCRFLKVNRYLISYGVDGMVFLWDISESKAVGFARIAEGQESIVSMAVSTEEDKAVCFTSSNRVCMVKLCELGSALPMKPWTTPSKGQVSKADTSPQLQEEVASTSENCNLSLEDDMFEAMSSSDSEEEMDFSYYLSD